MPLGLLKYGLGDDFPFEDHADLPGPTALRDHYDVVIIGGGGHGVATAYYLAKYHGITNVAVLEKAYLGGGNTARASRFFLATGWAFGGPPHPASPLQYFLQVAGRLAGRRGTRPGPGPRGPRRSGR